MVTKPKRRTLSSDETLSAFVRLLDHYRISGADPDRHSKLLYCVLRDGLVRLPPKRRMPRPRGRPPQFTAQKEQDLFNDIDHIREKRARNEAVATGKPLRSVKRIGIVAAIKLLQTRFPEKWGEHGANDLRKRYYNAKLVRSEAWRSILGLPTPHRKTVRP
jgi:hypothetical protein